MTIAEHAHFNDYNPADFGWGGRDPEANAGLLVPFSHSGVSFGSMHRDVVSLFTALLDELVPLIPGGLVAGTCGCYNPGSVTVGGDRSFHTYAIAIDVNWSANPMYAKAHPSGPHTLPSATSAIAKKYGCEWGGDWSYPQDWMHIECHLSPADAQAFTAVVPPTDPRWSDTVTKDELVQLIKANSIDEAHLRAAVFGGNVDLHKRAPGLYPDAGHGLTDRLIALEAKVGK